MTQSEEQLLGYIDACNKAIAYHSERITLEQEELRWRLRQLAELRKQLDG